MSCFSVANSKFFFFNLYTVHFSSIYVISQQMHRSDSLLVSYSSYMFQHMYVIIRGPSFMCNSNCYSDFNFCILTFIPCIFSFIYAISEQMHSSDSLLVSYSSYMFQCMYVVIRELSLMCHTAIRTKHRY
jgi:hypothetical protein